MYFIFIEYRDSLQQRLSSKTYSGDTFFGTSIKPLNISFLV